MLNANLADTGEPRHSPHMNDAHRHLETVFGYRDFRGNQAAIIEHVIGGGDALVLMPTGAGKSLCYQIPALVRAGTGIVVSPLIALMQDQVDALAQLGVRAAFLNSSQDNETARKVENDLQQGSVDLLYVAPERLLNGRFLNLLRTISPALFAIDEAHCVSQWGHDFRPEYQKLSILHEQFPNVPRIALTATADTATREEIILQLKLQQARVFVTGFDRPNIRYRVTEKTGSFKQLTDFLDEKGRRGQAGIIYCGSRRKVEETAERLSERGYKALPYHAGMTQDARRKHQQRFLREDGVIMVATVAFGMGIDKPDVRFVAHLDLPQSLEAYYQETGRAGRDGEPAEAWMTYSLGDAGHLHQRIEESETPDAQKRAMRQKLEAILGFCETVQCRRATMLDYFGEKHAPCGNCDTCLEPPQTWDGTIAAQKVMSAALRTGQRFGAGYLIDILLGKTNERMQHNGHDRLPTFGVGKDMQERAWRAVTRQLIAGGYLYPDVAKFGALQLTEKARPILKGETKLHLRPLRERLRRRDERTRAREESAQAPVNETLFAALRETRKKLADAQNVPAYVIFHDSTLREMAQKHPVSLEAMRGITGIGERKLNQYGEMFLDVLKQYPSPAPGAATTAPLYEEHPTGAHGKIPTAEISLNLFRQTNSVIDVAAQRGIKPQTVYIHLAEAIVEGRLALEDVVKLTKAEYAEIEKAFNASAGGSPGKLSPIFENLGGKYDYGILRCVAAVLWQDLPR